MNLPWNTTVTDWNADEAILVRGRYGVIEAAAGGVTAVHLRPLAKLLSWPEVWPVGPLYHARGANDQCWLYYNQPRRFPRFLALKYMISTAGASMATCRAALASLDAIAELKGVDALLCDVSNRRVSDRLLRRCGWEPHKPQRWHRNFIKRFYGEYPSQAPPGRSSLDVARRTRATC
ncbi:MAG: hypothetical protein AAF961_07390 [Planctomycetota bacterium]